MSNAININSNKVCDKVIQPVIFRGHDDVQPFDPYDLFISGRTGVYFDPSDFSTLFQDSAGTIPVTVAGQPVGLMLDVHKSGSWTPFTLPPLNMTATVTQSGNVFTFDNSPKNAGGILSGALVANRYVKVEAEFLGTGSCVIIVGGMFVPVQPSVPVSFYSPCANNDQMVVSADDAVSTTGVLTLQMTSVEGNHASQPTTTKRPILEESGGLYSLKFDGIDDELITTFPAPLGSNCTIGIAVKPAATILTGQTVDATYVMNTDNYGVVIVDDALTPEETANLTEWLNAKAGNV